MLLSYSCTISNTSGIFNILFLIVTLFGWEGMADSKWAVISLGTKVDSLQDAQVQSPVRGDAFIKIGVWLGSWQIHGVEAWLADGNIHIFGETTGVYREFTFQPGEVNTYMIIVCTPRCTYWSHDALNKPGKSVHSQHLRDEQGNNACTGSLQIPLCLLKCAILAATVSEQISGLGI